MEASSSTPQAPRAETERTNAGPKGPSRASEKDRTDTGKSIPSAAQPVAPTPKVTRHKEKFLAMKEKYEQATSTHEQYERELAIANEKIRSLQNECNLLLDAVDIAVPGQPTLMHYLQHDPVPAHYTTANQPVYPEILAAPLPVEPTTPGRSIPKVQSNGTNGHL